MSMPQEGYAVKHTGIETKIFTKTVQISFVAFWILRGFIFPTEVFQAPFESNEVGKPAATLQTS